MKCATPQFSIEKRLLNCNDSLVESEVKTRKTVATGVLAGIAGVLLVMLLAVVFAAYTGSYNIAASEDHTPFVRWIFDTTMRNSVQRQADGLDVPELTEEMVASGAREYKAMCVHCHGGPGVDPDAFSRGMLPQPPRLHEAASEWNDREIFWLVKHGVKMTGMPAFGENHDDKTLWNIVAFVMKLPGMTEEEYRRFETAGHHE